MKYGANAAALVALALSPPAPAAQDMSSFRTGPVFTDFGPYAPVGDMTNVPAESEFFIAFDVGKAAAEGAYNHGFESAARFINMHVAAGVSLDNIHLVVVVHGGATRDVISNAAWAIRNEGRNRTGANPSSLMVQEMIDAGVRFIVCGQSRAANGIMQDDLMSGVETALSAMTVHAQLQQRGYTVNPF